MEVCFIMVQKFMHTLDLFYPDKSFTGLQRPELSVQCITFTTDKVSGEFFCVRRRSLYHLLRTKDAARGEANKNHFFAVQCWVEEKQKSEFKIDLWWWCSIMYFSQSNWMPVCGALLKLITDLTLALSRYQISTLDRGTPPLLQDLPQKIMVIGMI